MRIFGAANLPLMGNFWAPADRAAGAQLVAGHGLERGEAAPANSAAAGAPNAPSEVPCWYHPGYGAFAIRTVHCRPLPSALRSIEPAGSQGFTPLQATAPNPWKKGRKELQTGLPSSDNLLGSGGVSGTGVLCYPAPPRSNGLEADVSRCMYHNTLTLSSTILWPSPPTPWAESLRRSAARTEWAGCNSRLNLVSPWTPCEVGKSDGAAPTLKTSWSSRTWRRRRWPGTCCTRFEWPRPEFGTGSPARRIPQGSAGSASQAAPLHIEVTAIGASSARAATISGLGPRGARRQKGRSRATAAARRGAFSTTGLFPPTNPRSFRVRGMTVVVALSNSSTYKSLEVICPAGSRVFWSASNHLERDPQIWLVGFLCGQRPKDLDPIFIRQRHQLTHVRRRGRRQS